MGSVIDVEVRPVDGHTWEIVDLFGRPMGTVDEMAGVYAVKLIGGRMEGMDPGPFTTLQRACQAIGIKVRGACRLGSGNRAKRPG